MVNGEGTKVEGQTEATDVVDEEIVDDPEATVVLTEVDAEDGMAETVVDLNVEAMVAKIENADEEVLAQKREAKKRLDEAQEKLNEDDQFGSTYAFDLDDDLTT
ncbi:MAG: hypothetical protein ACR2QL_13625 [Woeseiaceae bacterium]